MCTDSIEHRLDRENIKKERKTEVYSSPCPGDVEVCQRAAQYVIVHCLMLASWEVVTRVFSSIQARPLTWCNLWESADIKAGNKTLHREMWSRKRGSIKLSSFTWKYMSIQWKTHVRNNWETFALFQNHQSVQTELWHNWRKYHVSIFAIYLTGLHHSHSALQCVCTCVGAWSNMLKERTEKLAQP